MMTNSDNILNKSYILIIVCYVFKDNGNVYKEKEQEHL